MSRSRMPFLSLIATVVLVAGLALAGCRGGTTHPDEIVVRVGDAFLTEDDLQEILLAVPPGMDPSAAREQYIEQWLTTHLLAYEARRQGLAQRPDVIRQLEDNERTVLASALLAALYDDEAEIERSDLESYFERNRDRMRLREAYLRVRFIEASDRDSAEAARDQLLDAVRAADSDAAADSMFMLIARRYAADTTASMALAKSYVPQSRLAREAVGAPWSVVGQLRPGDASQVIVTSDSTFFFVQVVERVPEGAEPHLDWVMDEVSRQVLIQNRKSSVAREVQRLRNEAEARGDLRIRDSRVGRP